MKADSGSGPVGAEPGPGPGLGPSGVREVKSAARAVQLLEMLAARRNQPTRLRDLADALGTPRSSTYALLRTLVDRGWVRTDRTGTLYGIGLQALLAGSSYLDVDPVELLIGGREVEIVEALRRTQQAIERIAPAPVNSSSDRL
jgi:predicted transcriptional regulator